MPTAGAEPSVEATREALRRSLPDHMVPVHYVMLDALPLTPSGKSDRRALPEPEPTLPAMRRTIVAPRTPLEARIAQVW